MQKPHVVGGAADGGGGGGSGGVDRDRVSAAGGAKVAGEISDAGDVADNLAVAEGAPIAIDPGALAAGNYRDRGAAEEGVAVVDAQDFTGSQGRAGGGTAERAAQLQGGVVRAAAGGHRTGDHTRVVDDCADRCRQGRHLGVERDGEGLLDVAARVGAQRCGQVEACGAVGSDGAVGCNAVGCAGEDGGTAVGDQRVGVAAGAKAGAGGALPGPQCDRGGIDSAHARGGEVEAAGVGGGLQVGGAVQHLPADQGAAACAVGRHQQISPAVRRAVDADRVAEGRGGGGVEGGASGNAAADRTGGVLYRHAPARHHHEAGILLIA